MALFLPFLLAAVVSTLGPMAEPLPASAFDYVNIATQPPVLRERRVDGVIIRDVSIPKSSGGSTPAYIVLPADGGPYGGALMVHWLGEHDSNRNEFLDDAVALAHHGIASILPNAMWSSPGWYETGRSPATDYASSIEQVKELRRVLDVLFLQPGLNPQRVGFVGHDFGAMYGALLTAVDARPRFGVFMAAAPSFNDWYLYGNPPANVQAYKAQMAVLDPALYLAQTKLVDALFQFARRDFYVPPAKFAAFYVADHGKKALRLYDAHHDLEIAPAIEERRAWLEERLGVQSIPRAAAMAMVTRPKKTTTP